MIATTTRDKRHVAALSGDLTLSGGSKSFGERHLWSDLDLTFAPTTITCFKGRSGSGKTTLLNCLGLLEPFTEGTLTFRGERIDQASRREARKLRRDSFGYLFQNYALVEQWTSAKNLAVPLIGRVRRRAERSSRIASALEAVGMQGYESTLVSELSGGEQQRLAFARLLLHESDVVFVDEPTASLDEHTTDTLLGLLRGLADSGAIVIVSTHDEAVRAMADHIISL